MSQAPALITSSCNPVADGAATKKNAAASTVPDLCKRLATRSEASSVSGTQFASIGKGRRCLLQSEKRSTQPNPQSQARPNTKRGAAAAGVSKTEFLKDLWKEIQEDNISNGAAALAYFLMLSIFPAAIFGLSLLPYLPIPDLGDAIMSLLGAALPSEAAGLFTDTVQNVASQRQGGLLSFGLLATLWAGSNGLFAIMQQLNITYDVKESRPFWKVRGTAVLLTLFFGVLLVAAFGLIVFGGHLQSFLGDRLGSGSVLLIAFAAFRWAVILTFLLLSFALVYYFGPDVEQRFRFITPGSLVGTAVLILAALAFRFYVVNFASYDATYGSLGAVIILLFWLYITGLVILLGSEVNALVEHYSAHGKDKGNKAQPATS